MSRLLIAAVAVLCLGVSVQDARAGANPTPTLSLQFNPTSVTLNPGGTTVTAGLTAMIGNPSMNDMFGASFSSMNLDFSLVPSPLTSNLASGISPFDPDFCDGAGMITCQFSGIQFQGPATPGTFSFTAHGTLADGSLIEASSTFRTTVPEPGVVGLLSFGLVALGLNRRRATRRDA